MFNVYVIKSQTSGKIYIGQTENLEKRLRQHNNKEFDTRSYTKLNKGPWIIVYKENHNTRGEVLKREKYLKSHHGRDFLKTIMGR